MLTTLTYFSIALASASDTSPSAKAPSTYPFRLPTLSRTSDASLLASAAASLASRISRSMTVMSGASVRFPKPVDPGLITILPVNTFLSAFGEITVTSLPAIE